MMEAEEKNKIGRCIKEGLSIKRMKQKELAQMMGKSNALISEWISGRKIPRGDDLIKIVTILEVSHLLFPERKKEPEDTIGEGEKTKKIKKLQHQIAHIEQKFEVMEKKFTISKP